MESQYWIRLCKIHNESAGEIANSAARVSPSTRGHAPRLIRWGLPSKTSGDHSSIEQSLFDDWQQIFTSFSSGARFEVHPWFCYRGGLQRMISRFADFSARRVLRAKTRQLQYSPGLTRRRTFTRPRKSLSMRSLRNTARSFRCWCD